MCQSGEPGSAFSSATVRTPRTGFAVTPGARRESARSTSAAMSATSTMMTMTPATRAWF